MKRKFLAVPFLVIIIFIVVGVGGVAAALLIGGAGGTEEVNLQKGLVGWWKFNGNAKDSTPNSNHGTGTGVILAADRKGQANKAYSFNGSSDYVNAGNGTSFPITGDISISAWVKPTTLAGQDIRVIASKGSWVSDGWEFFVRSSAPNVGQISFWTAQSGAGQTTESAAGEIADGNWYHIVVTRTGAVAKIYKNGADVTVTSGTHVDPTTNTRNVIIGSKNTANAYWWNGSMDDVRIYNRALSATEITALYQEYDPGIVISDLQKGLIGNWKMNGNAKDSSPNSSHGSTANVTLTTDRKGQLNKAYSFNGSSSRITVPLSSAYVSPISASFWAKLQENKVAGVLSFGANTASDKGFQIAWDGSGSNWHTFWGTNGGAYDALDSIGIAYSTSWQHITFVHDGSNAFLYVNGALNNNKETALAIFAGTDYNDIGNVQRTFWINGFVDDVKIYNRVLSAAEVADLYNEYDPGIVMSDLQKGLVAQWKMDGNAKDATPNSNHGTVTEAVLTTDRKGQLSRAYSFDGNNDVITVSDADSLDLTTKLTLSAWINPNSYKTYVQRIINKAVDASTRDYDLGLSNVDNKLYLYTAGASTGNSVFTVSLDTWTHVAVTMDTTAGEIFFYKNGVADPVIAYSTPLTANAASLLIGNFTGLSRNFSGLMDDVRIYNRALSAAEITTLYESY